MQYQEDRNLTERLVADTEYLTREIATIRIATGDLATRDFLRGEVRDLADELTALLAGEADRQAKPSAECRTRRGFGVSPAVRSRSSARATGPDSALPLTSRATRRSPRHPPGRGVPDAPATTTLNPGPAHQLLER